MPTKNATKKTVTKKKVTKKVVPKKAVKKTVRKSVAKKTIKKSAAKKKATKESLVIAADHESFWVTNGQILNSLVALHNALDEMEKEVYRFHTDKAKNDFANWVDVVLKDTSCAKELLKAKTAKSAKTVVVKHLKSYSI